jgi:hypothetical protein
VGFVGFVIAQRSSAAAIPRRDYTSAVQHTIVWSGPNCLYNRSTVYSTRISEVHSEAFAKHRCMIFPPFPFQFSSLPPPPYTSHRFCSLQNPALSFSPNMLATTRCISSSPETMCMIATLAVATMANCSFWIAVSAR